MKKISENEYKKAEVRIEELLLLTAITETDRYFSDPEIKMRIAYSLEQAARGELTTLPKEDIKKILGVSVIRY